jgi:predicted nucleotidyltransferase
MTYSWKTCPTEVKEFVLNLQKKINEIIGQKVIGNYLHGSLAMSCFNPKRSDMDVIVITNEPLSVQVKRKLAQFLLHVSNSPYQVEISILHDNQLKNWQHPCPFDFHYSEFWRRRYEEDLDNDTSKYLNGTILTDPDLAAHITILNHRGICLEGESIKEVFPVIPQSDYLSSIMGDFQECLENIEEDPIYCSLNLLRVYWYLKKGVISSKLEAGQWGLVSLQKDFQDTISKVVSCYKGENDSDNFTKEELYLFRNFVKEKVFKLHPHSS